MKARVLRPLLPTWRRAKFRLAEPYLRYVTRPERIRPFNRVVPLLSGREAFPAMLDAIRGARSHVHLEMYILRADAVGQEFQKAFIDRARAGVRVRLLLDSLGSFALPAWFTDELQAAGVEIVEYAPIAPWRSRWGLNRRDHQKILVVDDEIAFTGGINIGDEYAPLEWGGGGWFDMHALVEGPAVFDLARAFCTTWIKAGGNPLEPPKMPVARPKSATFSAATQVISNVGVRSRSHMRHAYIRAIARADASISIMNAYFIPDRGLRRAFARASRRGVDVRVIVPSISDVRAVYYASRHLYARLMKSGVRIFEWPERMMHAKCGVIDSVWSTIGSYNLDRRSLLHNLEVALIAIDRGLGERMQAQFETELAGCTEVVAEEWEKRSLWNRCLEWFFFRLRYWL